MAEPEYRIEAGWLVGDIGYCTGGGCLTGGAGHEPSCGMQPIARIEEVLAALERDRCICNTGPNTEGPEETCPRHGRPYAYWVERADTLEQRLAEIEARHHARVAEVVEESAR